MSTHSLHKTMNDPLFDPVRTRRWRRRLSLANVAVTVLLVACVFALDRWPFILLAGLLLAGWMVTAGLLNASTYGLTELRSAHLDDVQQRLRDDAYRQGYRLLTVVVPTALAVVAVSQTRVAAEAAAVAVVFVVLGVPVHLLAWRLPDEDAEPDARAWVSRRGRRPCGR